MPHGNSQGGFASQVRVFSCFQAVRLSEDHQAHDDVRTSNSRQSAKGKGGSMSGRILLPTKLRPRGGRKGGWVGGTRPECTTHNAV